MGKFIEYQFTFELIEDLPKRVDLLLKYITGINLTYEVDKIPNHPLFVKYKWENLFRIPVTPSRLPVHASIENNVLFMSGSIEEEDGRDKIYDFIDWVSNYMIRPRGKQFMGFYRCEGDVFPWLILGDFKGLGHVDLNGIFMPDSEVLVDPKNKRIIEAHNVRLESLPEGLVDNIKNALTDLVKTNRTLN